MQYIEYFYHLYFAYINEDSNICQMLVMALFRTSWFGEFKHEGFKCVVLFRPNQCVVLKKV